MALLHVLKEAGFLKLVVCHLDHGLRGRESAGDARFVRKVGEGMGYAVEAGKVDLRAVMKEAGESLETAGRRARHGFFAECARKWRCKSLLLAHHADDQAETVLWNLMRGSAGCRGMRMVSEMEMAGRKMEVIRPLLGVRKAELEGWMRERGFGWREDASNAVNDVVRNRIRNEVMPLLCEIAKRDVGTLLARGAVADEGMREVVAWALEKADARDPQGRLHLGVLRELPDVLKKAAVVDLLRSAGVGGIGADLVERCVGLLDLSGAASVNLPGAGRLRRRQGRVFVESA